MKQVTSMLIKRNK